MLESIFLKLHIKQKPNKVLTYFFYGITIVICIFCFAKMLKFIFGDIVMENNISPYLYAIFFTMPVLGFSYYVNSGIPKNDDAKVKMYILTVALLSCIVGSMV